MRRILYRDVFGTSSDNSITGKSGADRIFGFEGKDQLYGVGGDDLLYGGPGNDVVDGGPGADTMYGGSGDDLYRVDDIRDVISEESTGAGIDDGGIDSIESTITYTLGNFLEKLTLTGTAAIDATGNELANVIKGNESNNVLSGRGGADDIRGNGGNDILVGGAGKDTLTGGTGSDTFVFGKADATSTDRVVDFEVAADWIGIFASDYGLSNAQGLINGQLDASYFAAVSGTQKQGTIAGHGQFLYNSTTSTLMWDADGAGATASGVAIATFGLVNNASVVLTADRFHIATDLPTVTVSSSTPDPQSEDSQTYFVVSLSTPASDDVTISYSTFEGTATAGADFVGVANGTVIIPAGSTSTIVKIDLVDDNLPEGTENFTLHLDAALLGSTNLNIVGESATASIADETPYVTNMFMTRDLGGLNLGSTDPSGMAYVPGVGLFLSDSEVDETPFSRTNNLFLMNPDGSNSVGYSLFSFTREPTGLAFDAHAGSGGRLYITDDDLFKVFWVDPHNPTVLLGSFKLPASCDDPEDIAVDPNTGHLFIINGDQKNSVNSCTIIELDPNTGLQVGDAIRLDRSIVIDAEALVYDAQHDLFYVGSDASSNIWCVDHSGKLVDTITILSGYPNPTSGARAHVKDLEFAPSSDPTDDPSVQSLYVADYGNNHTTATASDDGRIFEIHLGDRAPLLLSRANAPTIIEVVDDVDPVSGSLVSGSKTNDSDLAVTVSLVGTGAIAGNAVQLYDGTGTTTTMGVAQVLSTADIAAGFASLQTGALTDATTYNITARITDPAGNQSGASNRFTVTEDRTAPAAPTQLSLDPSTDSGTKGDGFTSFTAVKIDGTAEPGSTVTLYEGTTVLGSGHANATAAFSLATTTLSTGTHNIVATVTDGAGNTSPVSTAYSVTIGDATSILPSHVVVVVMENHSFSEIIGNPAAPQMNLWAAEGTLFTNYHAITHPSEPNYFALFSGSTQGITDDGNYFFPTTQTLAGELQQAGYTFIGYAEASKDRDHDPWESFGDSQAMGQDFSLFPTDFSQLPNVSFVIPNLLHDVHNGSIADGDQWLAANLDAYANWAMSNNSVLVLTFDEDDNTEHNRVATIVLGAHVGPGESDQPADQYNLLHTIESMYNLPGLTPNDQNAPVLVFAPVYRAPAISEVADNVAPMTDPLAENSSTNDSDLTVKVSLAGTGAAAGATMRLYDGTTTSNALGSAVVLSSADITAGFVSIQTGALTEGTNYNITARIADTSGNQSDPSGIFRVTEDRTAPTPVIIEQPAPVTSDSTAAFIVSTSNNETSGVSYAYEIDGATTWSPVNGNTLSITGLADGSHTIQLQATDAAGNISVTAANYGWIIDQPGTVIVNGLINGNAAEGSTLTASVIDADGVSNQGVVFHWQQLTGVNWAEIFVGDSYLVGFDTTASASLRVNAIYNDGLGENESALSPTVSFQDVNGAGGVLISGTPAEGQTLTASVTDPDGVPATGVTYTWQALVASSWTTLQSGGSNQYVVPYDTHTGEPVRVLASYTDAQNHAESLTSAATNAVTDVNRPGDVLISGTVAEGQTLTASVSDPDGNPMGDVTYTWQALVGSSWTTLQSGSSNQYTLPYNAAGEQVRVLASYTDAQSHAESLTSAATSAVTDVSIVTLTTNSDVVTFATSAAHTVNGVIGTGATLSNGDSLTGAAGSDTLRISGNNSSFDLNSLAGFTGFEFVDLTGTGQRLVLKNGQNITVNGGNGTTVTLGTGIDTVTFSTGTNTVNAALGSGATLNTGDRLTGGSGIDTLNVSGSGTSPKHLVLDLGSGLTAFEQLTLTGSYVDLTLGSNQTLTLTQGSNDTATITGSGNTIALGPGTETVAFSNTTLVTAGNTVSLGSGIDTISFKSGTNMVQAVIGTGATVTASEKLTGGAGIDTLSLSGTGALDLNKLSTFVGFENAILAGTGESLTLKNGQDMSVSGGTGNIVTLGTGHDTLTFASGANVVNAVIGKGATLNSVDSLTGGSGVDQLVLSGTGSVDLNSLTKFAGFEEVDVTGSGQTLIAKDNLNAAQILNLIIADKGTNAVTHGDTFVFHQTSFANYTLANFVWDSSGSLVHDSIQLSKSLLANTSETSSQWLNNSFGQTNVTQDSAGHAVIHDGNNTIVLDVGIVILGAHSADLSFV